MIRLDGKPVVEAHQKKLTAWLDTMKNQGLNIQMGILLVGNDRSAQMYLSFMEKKAKQAGLGVVKVQLPETATQKEVEEAKKLLMEDARKFYVAISRAKKRLCVSYARTNAYGYPTNVTPFMRSIRKYFLEGK